MPSLPWARDPACGDAWPPEPPSSSSQRRNSRSRRRSLLVLNLDQAPSSEPRPRPEQPTGLRMKSHCQTWPQQGLAKRVNVERRWPEAAHRGNLSRNGYGKGISHSSVHATASCRHTAMKQTSNQRRWLRSQSTCAKPTFRPDNGRSTIEGSQESSSPYNNEALNPLQCNPLYPSTICGCGPQLLWLHFEIVRGPVGVAWGQLGSGLETI